MRQKYPHLEVTFSLIALFSFLSTMVATVIFKSRTGTHRINHRHAITKWSHGHGISNHRLITGLFNSLIKLTTMTATKLRLTGSLWGQFICNLDILSIMHRQYRTRFHAMTTSCNANRWPSIFNAPWDMLHYGVLGLHAHPDSDSDSDSDKIYSTKRDTGTLLGLHNFHEYTNNNKSLTHKWL